MKTVKVMVEVPEDKWIDEMKPEALRTVLKLGKPLVEVAVQGSICAQHKGRPVKIYGLSEDFQ